MIWIGIYLFGAFISLIITTVVAYYSLRDEYLDLSSLKLIYKALIKEGTGTLYILSNVLYPLTIIVILIITISIYFWRIPAIIIEFILHLLNINNRKILSAKIALLQVGDKIRYTSYNSINDREIDDFDNCTIEEISKTITIRDDNNRLTSHSKSKIVLLDDNLIIVNT